MHFLLIVQLGFQILLKSKRTYPIDMQDALIRMIYITKTKLGEASWYYITLNSYFHCFISVI